MLVTEYGVKISPRDRFIFENRRSEFCLFAETRFFNDKFAENTACSVKNESSVRITLLFAIGFALLSTDLRVVEIILSLNSYCLVKPLL